MTNVLDAKELLRVARERWPDDRTIMKQTGLSRTTLWRIDKDRFQFRPITLGKLVKALNE